MRIFYELDGIDLIKGFYHGYKHNSLYFGNPVFQHGTNTLISVSFPIAENEAEYIVMKLHEFIDKHTIDTNRSFNIDYYLKNRPEE